MFNLFRRKNGTYNKTFFISHFYSNLCDASVSCLKLCRGRDLTKDCIVNYNNNSPFSRFIKKSFCEVDGLIEARIIKPFQSGNNCSDRVLLIRTRCRSGKVPVGGNSNSQDSLYGGG